ncbi:hypothetical protein [Streptomyces spongiae]|uniref:DUF3592 domain-containing protein n=1 Tax=Streptomyces spongiae TaxID=565072 RepID=A0A5N8XD38_9ACTN|nr:hypothetical protein [Streptomyces spongiae]MPY56445.1 hypothetical protein [Streptomyces spongiae]
MKTDASGDRSLRKTGSDGTRAGTGPAGAGRGAGGRVGAGVLGVLVLLLGLILVAVGYEDGPKKVADGTSGTITIARCGKADDSADVECSGTFRSDDGKLRYDVEDFEPGADHGKGEKVDAMAFSTVSFDPGTPASFYVEGARAWCVAAAMFGVSALMLSRAFGSRTRPVRRGTAVTGLSLLFGGLLGCGLCVLVNSVLV